MKANTNIKGPYRRTPETPMNNEDTSFKLPQLQQCGPTRALVKEINSRQLEMDAITGQVLSAEPHSISAEIGRIREIVIQQLGDIRQILKVACRKPNPNWPNTSQEFE